MTQKEGTEFKEVLEDELNLLDRLRRPRREGASKKRDSVYLRAHNSDLAGLAFSGGGIRSATFNLGVIQALAHYDFLSRFDYLSTVSGGGFIGGWLSALLDRQAKENEEVDQTAVEKFQSNLKTHPEESRLDATVGFKPVEHKAVRYLRGYSNYLSPRLGLSGDALAAASTFLRNFVLIQLNLVSLVASILLFAHVVGVLSMKIAGKSWPIVIGALALGAAAFFAGWLSAEKMQPDREDPAKAARAVFGLVIGPCMLAAWLLSAAISTPMNAPRVAGQILTGEEIGWWILIGAAAYGAAWLWGSRAMNWRRRQYETARGGASNIGDKSYRDSGARLTHVSVAIVCGALLGLLMYVTVKKVFSVAPIDPWHAAAFGPPLFLLGLSFVVTVHIGAARRVFTDPDREWFARLGGFVLWFCAAWTTLFVLVLYATPFVQWLKSTAPAALVAWAAGSGLGSWLAHGPNTSGKKGGVQWKEVAVRIAPWLFIAGLAIVVAHATHIALVKYEIGDVQVTNGSLCQPDANFCLETEKALKQLDQLRPAETSYALIAMWILFFLLARRFDINLFSLHTFYHYRLARAYLGASSPGQRKPNPFTGFDPDDDLPFQNLARQRPIPIINTAVNMTGGDDLAWQTRRAASFAFTPQWVGYETRSTQGVKLGTYRPTSSYAGGLQLGSLMAVSGAAASPNMGYHTSAAVAALLTAFNVRLGRWCGNPKHAEYWSEKSPKMAAKPIFSELTGSATAQAGWINLTDGGHFDNLGVYELIRRRCRLIIVTDAGCDPKYQFEDLANTVRKCWTDLGVNIRFETFEPMHLKKDSRYCDAHGVVGRIEYHHRGPEDAIIPDGAIIYLKSSLTGDEWPDIRQYADTHDDFPHETTADQFFDENQFEAYRHLGYKVAAKMISALANRLSRKRDDVHNVPIAEIADTLVPGRPQ